MQDFWAVLIKLIMDYLKRWLDPIDATLAPRMGAALEDAAASSGIAAPTSFGAAPDELKVVIRQLIVDLVNKTFTNRPAIRALLLALANNLPDSLIDSLWDAIFKSGQVAFPAPVRGHGMGDANPFAAALNAELS